MLVAKTENLLNAELGEAFTTWVGLYDPKNKEGGQYVAETYTGDAQIQKPAQPLYTRAPAGWKPPTSIQ